MPVKKRILLLQHMFMFYIQAFLVVTFESLMENAKFDLLLLCSLLYHMKSNFVRRWIGDRSTSDAGADDLSNSTRL